MKDKRVEGYPRNIGFEKRAGPKRGDGEHAIRFFLGLCVFCLGLLCWVFFLFGVFRGVEPTDSAGPPAPRGVVKLTTVASYIVKRDGLPSLRRVGCFYCERAPGDRVTLRPAVLSHSIIAAGCPCPSAFCTLVFECPNHSLFGFWISAGACPLLFRMRDPPKSSVLPCTVVAFPQPPTLSSIKKPCPSTLFHPPPKA